MLHSHIFLHAVSSVLLMCDLQMTLHLSVKGLLACGCKYIAVPIKIMYKWNSFIIQCIYTAIKENLLSAY